MAQSIHRYSGIQFQLAPERRALGAQIRWAFAEAAGAVQARVQEAPVLLNNNGQAAHLYSINLVDTDVKGTFYIRFGQIAHTFSLKAPGNQRKIFDLLAFNDNKSSKGIDVQRGEDWLQVTIYLPGINRYSSSWAFGNTFRSNLPNDRCRSLGRTDIDGTS